MRFELLRGLVSTWTMATATMAIVAAISFTPSPSMAVWWCDDASNWSDVAGIQQCIGRGNDVNARDANGYTILHYAARYGSAEVVNALIDGGAEVDARDNYGRTTLRFMSRYGGDVAIAKALIEAGADLDARDNSGRTPLHAAAFAKNAGVAEALISNGADPMLEDDDGRTAKRLARGEARRVFHSDVIAKLQGTENHIVFIDGDSQLGRMLIKKYPHAIINVAGEGSQLRFVVVVDADEDLGG